MMSSYYANLSSLCPVYIDDDVFKELTAFLAPYTSYGNIFILVDENTRKLCLAKLINEVPILINAIIIEIQSGEKNKNISTCLNIWNELNHHLADRQSLLINLGGGIVGDIGGFVGSTYKRGIDFIQIPTTLLSQVDASVGGKTGVNLNELKNQIGVFNFPKAVFIYSSFLTTLDKRQFLSGFAEIIKHALIADHTYWKQINVIDIFNSNVWKELIIKSVQIKTNIVSQDRKEFSLRKSMNFGHTVGHAIETLSLQNNQNPLLHGEAVALGILYEVMLSTQLTGLSADERNKIIHFIKSHYPIQPIKENDYPLLIDYMKNDKKNKEGKIHFTLLKRIGKAVTDIACDETTILHSFRQLNTIL